MKRLPQTIFAAFASIAIILLTAGIVIFIGFGTCGIEGCDNTSYQQFESEALLVAIFGFTTLIIVNILLARAYVKSVTRVTQAPKSKLYFKFFWPVLIIVFVIPAILIASSITIVDSRQNNRLNKILSTITTPAGCRLTANHYSRPIIFVNYSCSQEVTNGQLYSNLTQQLKQAGYDKAYDDTFGSSDYNLYQFGFTKGYYDAVFIFNHQTRFSPEEANTIASQTADGYLIKLYESKQPYSQQP